MIRNRRKMVRSALFAALIAATALFFRVSSGIVPFSLVPLVIILGGLLLEPDEALTGTSLYLALGLVGFPVFAAPPFGGPMYVLQPTFGFLLGFLWSAPLLAFMVQRSRRRTFTRLCLLSGVAMGLLYLPGLIYLWLVLNFIMGVDTGIARVFSIGFWPFIGPDILKALCAALLAWRLRRLPWVAHSRKEIIVEMNR
ncbi:MAG TPA: biotin transporter BioY [Atribacteraceae bacterium]|nr:biotin transporter BioY [Atribacteraceae bacterium]